MDVQDILISFALNGVLIFIFKSIIQAAHDRDMATIQSEHAKDLAQMKADLDLAHMIQATRFADLHKRRAEIISDLYKLLAIAEGRLSAAWFPVPVIGGDKMTELEMAWAKIEPVYNAVTEVSVFYEENKIFFTVDQVQAMDQIVKIMNRVKMGITVKEFHTVSPPQNEAERAEDVAVVMSIFSSAYEEFRELYPPIKAALESDFREILGFDVS